MTDQRPPDQILHQSFYRLNEDLTLWDIDTSATFADLFTVSSMAIPSDSELRRVLEGIYIAMSEGAEPLTELGEVLLQPLFGSVQAVAFRDTDRVGRGLSESDQRTFAEAFLRLHNDVKFLDDEAIREATLNFVLDFRVPVYGSPPSTWRSLKDELGGPALGVAAFGASAADGRPLLMVATGAGVFVIWFATPIARIVRESAAKRMAKRMHVQFRREHLE
jgi:hypothetical protein